MHEGWLVSRFEINELQRTKAFAICINLLITLLKYNILELLHRALIEWDAALYYSAAK